MSKPTETSQKEPIHATLSEADGLAVDAWLANRTGDRAERVTDAEATRVEAVAALLGNLAKDQPGPVPGDLVQRTMRRIAAAKDRQAVAGGEAGRLSAPIRLTEVVALAAMLVLGVSLLWPMLAANRAEARRLACAEGLHQAASAFGHYANDHRGLMPRAEGDAADVWYNIGNPINPRGQVQSNTAHLYQLVRHGYAQAKALACPENEHAVVQSDPRAMDWPDARSVSYSFQNQHTREPMRYDRDPAMAILADRNPLFLVDSTGLKYRDDLSHSAASYAHGQRGQNILNKRGEVRWTRNPVLDNGDNIWLASGVSRYTGTERPRGGSDSFLVP